MNDTEEIQFHKILQNTPISVGIVKNRTIRFVNAEMCAMLGYDAEELLEQNVSICSFRRGTKLCVTLVFT